MSKRTNVLAMCALLMIGAIIPVGAATMTTSTTTAAATISVGEQPTAVPDGTITAEPGETVTVSVWANASAVSGYQTRLTFDPAVVRVEAVSGSGDFAAPVANVDNEDGSVDFNQIRDSDGDDPVLAEITLTVVGEAGESAALSFDQSDAETKFATDGGQTFLPQTYRDATVSVEDTQTETVTETPAPTTEEPPSTETPAPTTEQPTTEVPTTEAPTTTTEEPTTAQPTTEAPTTTTEEPTTAQPTTEAPTTTTEEPTTTEEQTTTEQLTTTTEEPTTTTTEESTPTETPTPTESSPDSNDDNDADDDDDDGGSSGSSSSSGGGGYSAPAEPSLAIDSVALNATNGSVGTDVTVSAVVENTGDADGEMDLLLGIDGDETGDEQTVEVEAGETRTVNFSVNFDTPGTYALAVNDVAAGTVTIAETASTETTTETSTAEATTTPSPTTTEAPATATPSGESTEPATTTGGSTPGFGFLVTLVAMTLLVGWRALGRDER